MSQLFNFNDKPQHDISHQTEEIHDNNN